MGKDTDKPKPLEMKDISTEQFREYYWPGDKPGEPSVTIMKPMALHVSESGGHRIIDSEGFSNYIPAGWRHLRWKVKEGEQAFSF